MRFKRHNVRYFLSKMTIEIPSVVFAVLLALGVNSWWNTHQNERMAEEMQQKIVLEVEENRKDLEEDISANEELLPQLQKLVAQLKSNEEDITNVTLGMVYSTLRSTAWQTANLTGALQHMDQEIVMEIADLYAVQEIYLEVGMAYIQQIGSIELNKESNRLPAAETNINQIKLSNQLGETLLALYQEFLEKYKTSY